MGCCSKHVLLKVLLSPLTHKCAGLCFFGSTTHMSVVKVRSFNCFLSDHGTSLSKCVPCAILFAFSSVSFCTVCLTRTN